MIKPKPLRPGAMFGIVSPASRPREEQVQAGIKTMQAMGYRTKLFPHALASGPLYYAGTASDRAADLHAAFVDPEVDSVICTRGGWGSAELLPLLDPGLVRDHAKPFLGYSDHTSLHLWLSGHVGMVSFQAPMVAADFSRGLGEGGGKLIPLGVHLPTWNHALTCSDPWELGQAEGLRMLRPGVAQGELTGGCLSIYAEALGTPWAASPRGGILFLEDIGVKPYQWDRMLVHLRLAGCFDGIKGIVFGDMSHCCQPSELPALEASLLHALQWFRGPIGIGLRSGHVDHSNVTLPFGVQVELLLLSGEAPTLAFLESAVAG